jgi:hypothetical protein
MAPPTLRFLSAEHLTAYQRQRKQPHPRVADRAIVTTTNRLAPFHMAERKRGWWGNVGGRVSSGGGRFNIVDILSTGGVGQFAPWGAWGGREGASRRTLCLRCRPTAVKAVHGGLCI